MGNTISLVAIIGLAIATLVVLVIGLVTMVKGGEINQKMSNKLMVARVIFQALAIVMVVVLFAV